MAAFAKGALPIAVRFKAKNRNDVMFAKFSQRYLGLICGQTKQRWRVEPMKLKFITKIIYCPAHIGIEGNEFADGLAKIGAKKAKHLQPDPKITLP